jgi:hypothetical protein
METRNANDRGAGYDPATQQTPPTEKASIVEDFIDIFHAPSSVFARRATSGYGLHLLLVTVITALFTFANRGVIRQIMDAQFTKRSAEAIARNPRITQEMIDSQRPMQEAIGMFFIYAGTPLFILIFAIFIWLFAKIVSAKLSYKQAAMISTLAFIPRLIGSLVTTVQVALMDTSTVNNMFALSASPARFMDPETTSPKMLGLAGAFDVFSIWSMILIGIGIAVMGRVERGKGLLVAGILFVLGALPGLLFG